MGNKDGGIQEIKRDFQRDRTTKYMNLAWILIKTSIKDIPENNGEIFIYGLLGRYHGHTENFSGVIMVFCRKNVIIEERWDEAL